MVLYCADLHFYCHIKENNGINGSTRGTGQGVNHGTGQGGKLYNVCTYHKPVQQFSIPRKIPDKGTNQYYPITIS